MCPSACATSRRAGTAACRVSSGERAQRLFGRGDVLLARARGKRRRRGHDHPRIAILEVRPHQPDNLLAAAGGQRADRRRPHLRVIVFQHLLDAGRPPRLQVRARRFERAQRAGADLGRGVVEEQRRDQVPLVEALEQVDGMQHVPRVRMAEFLDERLDREQVGAECRRSCGCTFWCRGCAGMPPCSRAWRGAPPQSTAP